MCIRDRCYTGARHAHSRQLRATRSPGRGPGDVAPDGAGARGCDARPRPGRPGALEALGRRGQGADSTVPGATGLTAAVPSGAPRPSASPATAGPAFEAVAPTLPSLFGLDLGSMGMTDPHPAWGIAVAYAPSPNIDRAGAG